LLPLGMRATRFCPPASWQARIAPTEYDPGRGLVHGFVHDESAWALGGVCGHAGLFADALDLWRFAELWLAGGQLADRPFLQPATVAAATRETTRGVEGAFGLGWMLDRPAWMTTDTANCYGHTGFTGTTLLIDPRERLVVVLLANRTFPQRHPVRTHALVAAIVGAL
jgi:serine-type D-Ala-D-Ala carboxypeptidase